jgi:hypothetical protein
VNRQMIGWTLKPLEAYNSWKWQCVKKWWKD